MRTTVTGVDTPTEKLSDLEEYELNPLSLRKLAHAIYRDFLSCRKGKKSENF